MADGNRLQGLFGDPTALVTAAAAQAIARVRVRTSFTPPYEFNPFAPSAPAGAGQGGLTDWLMGYAKPEVTALDANGNVIFQWAPSGPPADNYVPHAVGVGAGAFAIAALLLGNVGVAKVAGAAALAAVGYGEAKNRGLIS